MSWDAVLRDEQGDELHWVNMTHNVNPMIAAAYTQYTGRAVPPAGGPLGPVIGPAWWDALDGASGLAGRDYLDDIIAGLVADPDRYRAMNPPNGWGDYDRLLVVLREMREAVPDGELSTWQVSG